MTRSIAPTKRQTRLFCRVLFPLTLAFLTFFCGCNRGPKCYPVTGTVTWNGEVVPVGSISFVPTDGGRPASGKIAEDGSYALSTFEPGDGVQAGNYIVLLECVEFPPSNVNEPKTFAEELANTAPLNNRVKPPKWIVPEDYASPASSKLKASITGATTMDFTLPTTN